MMAVRLRDDKPFVCTYADCGQGFTTEDRLAVHQRKHEAVFASLVYGVSIDQTPTPSHFLKDCDDGLFLPNPFDESFKHVNSCELPLLVPGPADTVTTPSIVMCRGAVHGDDDVVAVPAVDTVREELPLVSATDSADGKLAADLLKELQPDDCLADALGSAGIASVQSSRSAGFGDTESIPMPSPVPSTSGTRSSANSRLQQPQDTVHFPRPVHQAAAFDGNNSSGIVGTINSHVRQLSAVQPGSSAASCTLDVGRSMRSSKAAVPCDQQARETAGGMMAGLPSASSSTPCTMQLLLQMPNGQTVPLTLPAAIVPSMFGINSAPTTTQLCLSPAVLGSSSSSSSSSSANDSATASVGKNKVEMPRISFAKQKLKETLQRDSIAAGSVSSTGNSLACIANQTEQQQPYSEQCVGSTTGKLRRPRQSSSEDDPEDKRVKFLERNREAARRCRSKKKEWISSLEQRHEEQQAHQQRLQAEIVSLRAEVAELKCLLLEHKDCPVTLQQKQSGRLALVRSSCSNLSAVAQPENAS